MNYLNCGKKEYFSKEHYEKNSRHAPPYLCELVVHSLELVSMLCLSGLNFRFKGGNSLLVLLEDPMRFSIDVDIVTDASKDELTRAVEKIVSDSGVFKSFEVRPHKTKPRLPMISYNIFIDSFYAEKEKSFIMLDAVLKPSPYKGIKKQVKCLDLYESKNIVEVPDVSGLIADKFLTLSPKTLGIPLNKNKEAQRLKHVFDIALLTRQPYNMDEVIDALFKCVKQENEIQETNFKLSEIIKDTDEFLKTPFETPGGENPYALEIKKGFDGFKPHIFKFDYKYENMLDDFKRCRFLTCNVLKGAGI